MSVIRLDDYLRLYHQGDDCSLAIALAIRACKDERASALLVSPGVYHVRADGCEERYLFVTNNDAGMKRVAFLLEDMRDFELDARGATFLFHGRVNPVVVRGCRNICLTGFTIDYAERFFAQGTVLEADGAHIRLAMDETRFPYRIDNERVQFFGEGWTGGAVENLLELDAATRSPAYGMGDDWRTPAMRARRLADGTLELLDAFAKPHTVGSILVLAYEPRYCTGISILASEGVSLSDITIYHAPAMGVTAQMSADIAVRRLRVQPKSGTDDAVSCNADATHFVNCMGAVLLEDCVLESQLDDPLNCHGIYTTVERVLPDRSELLARFHHPQQCGVDIYCPDDALALIDPETCEDVCAATVESVRWLNQSLLFVRLREPLPLSAAEGLAIENRTRVCDLTVRNCRMGRNRARGSLISTPGKVLFEDNCVYSGGAGMLLDGADMRYWYESGRCTDVTIRGNRFERCRLGPWEDAVISVTAGLREQPRVKRFHRNIRILDNTFLSHDGAIVSAAKVDGLVVRGNRFVRQGGEAPLTGCNACVTAIDCPDACIEDNTLLGFEREQ